jgi:hypothetical protein
MWARPSPYPTQDIERPALPSLSLVFVGMTGNVTSAAGRRAVTYLKLQARFAPGGGVEAVRSAGCCPTRW